MYEPVGMSGCAFICLTILSVKVGLFVSSSASILCTVQTVLFCYVRVRYQAGERFLVYTCLTIRRNQKKVMLTLTHVIITSYLRVKYVRVIC